MGEERPRRPVRCIRHAVGEDGREEAQEEAGKSRALQSNVASSTFQVGNRRGA